MIPPHNMVLVRVTARKRTSPATARIRPMARWYGRCLPTSAVVRIANGA